MSKIIFYLVKEKKNKDGLYPIRMHVLFNNKQVKISTGTRALEKHWDQKTQKIKEPKENEPYNFYAEYNDKLRDYRQKAEDIFVYEFKINRSIEKLTKEKFKKYWGESDLKLSKGVLDAYDEFIKVNGPVKAERTITGYQTCRNFLENFVKYTGYELHFKTLDLDFFESFRSYAFEVKEISDNYFAGLIAKLKVFLSWALEKRYHDSLEYKKFQAPERPKTIVVLYEDELFKFYRHKFEKKKWERVRDVYCFACFTGLRFSDIRDLKREHIIGDEIQKVIVKTKEFQRIPLNKFAKEILMKYKDLIPGPFPRISFQKFNEYLKEAAEAAEINSDVVVVTYKGGKPEQEIVKKHQLITSHTARKTFTTNSLIFGMSESSVKKITGHKKDQNFQKYVRLAENYLKDEVKNTWDKRK